MEKRGGGSIVGLSYIGGVRVVPHYGGGMSTAKAALEIDAKQLAHNLGSKNIRVNIISAGPYASRAASAIGDIDEMIGYAAQRSPLPRRHHAGGSRRRDASSCAARWPRASPGTCSTSIAAITSWDFDYVFRELAMPPPSEPRNPFYLLLLIASCVFIVTALAYAVVPVLEQKARDMGQDPPPSPFRDSCESTAGNGSSSKLRSWSSSAC